MNRRMTVGIAATVAALLLVEVTPGTGVAGAVQPPTAEPRPGSVASASATPSAPERVRVRLARPHGRPTPRLSWSPAPGAHHYYVWKRSPGQKRFIRSPSRARRTLLVDKRARIGRLIRYQVQACSSSGACGPRSRAVSIRVARPGDKRQNAGRITYWKHPQAYGLMEQMPLQAAALPGRSKTRGRGKRPVSGAIRYLSTDPSVATVDAGGNLTARKVGRATIRMIAHNGLERAAPVRVVNFAYPTRFDARSIPGVGSIIQDYWTAEGPRISALTTSILGRRITSDATMTLDGNGNLVANGALPQDLQRQAKALLEDYWLPGTITISSRDPSVKFSLGDPETHGEVRLIYYYSYYGRGVPAPHWDVVWVS